MIKNKKGEVNPFVGFVLLLMVILIGLAFIISTADSNATITKKSNTVNESNTLTTCYAGSVDNWVNESFASCNVTVTNAPTSWKLTESQCALSSVTVTNSAGVELTADTDYTLFAQTGIVQFLNTTDTQALTNNVTLESYTWCPDGYLTASGDRGLLGLLPTLMIMVLLIVGAGFAYSKFKQR